MAPPINPQAFQYRDQFYNIPVPPWLRTGDAEKYMYVMNLMSDLLCEKAYEATTIRLPGVGDESNIPYLAYDRNLSQGPGETNAAFILRLQGAFAAWAEAGSALSILGQLQAYLQSSQLGVNPAFPLATIVGGDATDLSNYSNVWTQVYVGTPVGAPPTVTHVFPDNFKWDGQDQQNTWRRWLILPMALVAVPGLMGLNLVYSAATASACFTSPGQNVNGVWVPATSGTPVNSPWMTLTGLSGLTAMQVGQWITITGSGYHPNNGCFQITEVLSATSCVIANPFGLVDPSTLNWIIGEFPFIGPGPAWGQTGYVFGQGELVPPFLSTTALTGTFHVINGSASVSTSLSQVGKVFPQQTIQFGSQANVVYAVTNITASTITLVGPYTGTTNTATTGNNVVIDTGGIKGGVWQPTLPIGTNTNTAISWGLNCIPGIIASIRKTLVTWKSAGTYYPNIIVAFDAGDGTSGSAYSPNSSEGSGNPDGTFGSVGKNVNGVWVPTRTIFGNPQTPYLWDCFCQGTGLYEQCSIENVT